MNGLTTTIYRKSSELPELEGANFFHSRQLFTICEQVSRQRPYMVVTTDETGKVVSHMLGILSIRPVWLPPFLLIHCRILGEGVYAESGHNRDVLFGEMLGALTQKLNSTALYVEVSNLSHKMFGYKQLRQHGYYPINWMSIHNSLHSRTPEERISKKMQKRIDNAHAKGVVTECVRNEEDFTAFTRLLRRHNLLKPRRFIPDDTFFRQLMDSENGELFVTKYHGKVIGCSAVVYSEGNACLWYSAYRRKTYIHLHPDILTIWDTMKDAYQRGCQHMCFMDVGLPYSKNPFREFILRFGGKEQSTYRWFRFSIRWVNTILAWIYRE